MSLNTNPLLKLDLLELHHLSKAPRYPRTHILHKAKKTQAKVLPAIEDFDAEILRLKAIIFEKKWHAGEVKLTRVIKKVLKGLKKLTEEQQQWVKEEADSSKIAKSRLVKIVSTVFKANVKDASKNSRLSFIKADVFDAFTNRDNEINPATLYNSLSDAGRVVYSKLWSNKEIMTVIGEVELGFKIILGKVDKKKEKKDDKKQKEEEEEEDVTGSEDDGDDESQLGSDDSEEGEGEDIDLDAFSTFDKFLAASDDENEDEAEDGAVLDQNINYNEITDEEPSEQSDDESEEDLESEESDDDFFQEPLAKKPKTDLTKETKTKARKELKEEKKHKLPSLPDIGYISGGSDSDPDNDEVVKELSQPRKNRRGQRARQKIWERKYGREAKHVTKEREDYRNFREEKQRQYDERQAKREVKLKKAVDSGALASGANNAPLVPKSIREKLASGKQLLSKEIDKLVEVGEKKLHPSWEAKKRMEEQQKAVKFEGKKIKF